MREVVIPFPAYDFYSTDRLIEAYAAGAERLRDCLVGLSEDDLRAQPRGPGTWSAHEIVLHVLDSELQGVYRMRKVWAESGSGLPGYNQAVWAKALAYQSEPAEVRGDVLDLLGGLRRRMLPLLRAANATDWERFGTHPEYGRVTLRNLLELYADHTERHVSQILTIRGLLGKPLAMELMLPRRLY